MKSYDVRELVDFAERPDGSVAVEPRATIGAGDWMNSPCPVCGRRIGAHKAIVGWMGRGCPERVP